MNKPTSIFIIGLFITIIIIGIVSADSWKQLIYNNPILDHKDVKKNIKVVNQSIQTYCTNYLPNGNCKNGFEVIIKNNTVILNQTQSLNPKDLFIIQEESTIQKGKGNNLKIIN